MSITCVQCGGPAFAFAPADASTDGGLHAEAAADGGAHTDALVSCATEAGPTTGTSELIAGQTAPGAIGATDTDLYWATAETSSGGPGSIMTASRATLCPMVLAANQPNVHDLIIGGDQQHLYWSVSASGANPPSAMQCLAMGYAVGGSAPASCLATSDTYATQRLSGTAGFFVFLGQLNGQQNATFGFIVSNGGAVTGAAGQGPSSAIAASSVHSTILLDNRHGPHIDTYPYPALQPPGSLCGTEACGGKDIVDILVDDGAGEAYWAALDGSVLRQALGPTAAPGATTLATLPGTPQRMARGVGYLYVTLADGQGGGSVYGVPLVVNGTSQQIAQTAAPPFGIAVDGASIFWTTADGGIWTHPTL